MGRRNYRFFLAFVLCVTVFDLYVLGVSTFHATSLTSLLAEGHSPHPGCVVTAAVLPTGNSTVPTPTRSLGWQFRARVRGTPSDGESVGAAILDALSLCPLLFAVLFFAFIIALSILPLLTYHIGLLCSGLTTNEKVRQRGRPYRPLLQPLVVSFIVSRMNHDLLVTSPPRFGAAIRSARRTTSVSDSISRSSAKQTRSAGATH